MYFDIAKYLSSAASSFGDLKKRLIFDYKERETEKLLWCQIYEGSEKLPSK